MHEQRRTVFVEALTLDEAVLASGAGAGALILKGTESGGRLGDETAFALLQRCVGVVAGPLWVQGGIGLHTAAGAPRKPSPRLSATASSAAPKARA
jgi:NAD(P)H-dependent flavin oxidoreductase YrpB (nitropropane dioxygenase family)